MACDCNRLRVSPSFTLVAILLERVDELDKDVLYLVGISEGAQIS